MTESKVYKFEDSNSNWMPLITSMFQNRGFDQTALLSMLNNGGFGGMNGGYWFIWIIFLWMMWGNNGFFGNGRNGQQGLADLGNLINNDNGRELLMSAIQGNSQAISQLASTLNCSIDSVQQSINAVMTQIQSVGNQVGMTGQQVINAIQQGNCQLGSQLAQCCCTIQDAITRQGYENQIATANQTNVLQNAITSANYNNQIANLNQTNTLTSAINNVATGQERGFSSVAYETQRQTCDIQNSIKDATSQILEGQRAAEMRELQNKVDALREMNSQKDTVINNGQQTAIFSQMINQATAPLAGALNALQGDVNGIKCKMPETVTLPFSCATAIPTNVLYNGYGLFNGFSTFGSGCGCNGSLWG